MTVWRFNHIFDIRIFTFLRHSDAYMIGDLAIASYRVKSAALEVSPRNMYLIASISLKELLI